MPEWWSFAATERDRHVLLADLSREVNFLSRILTAHDLQSTGEELQCTLLVPEESHLRPFDKVRRRRSWARFRRPEGTRADGLMIVVRHNEDLGFGVVVRRGGGRRHGADRRRRTAGNA